MITASKSSAVTLRLVRVAALVSVALLACLSIRATPAAPAAAMKSGYVALSIVPDEVLLDSAKTSAQLFVLGELADGSKKDITSSKTGTKYTSADSKVAKVSAEGLVTVVGKGETSVKVSNGAVTGAVSVKVGGTNHAPTMKPIADQRIDLGQVVRIQVKASDADGDPLTYAVQPIPLPAHASFDAATGFFEFQPDESQLGRFQFTFTASDGALSVSETVGVYVRRDPNGETGITGRILDANDAEHGGVTPLIGAKVTSLGSGASTTTDSDGYFTLTGLAAGEVDIEFDGAKAQRGGRRGRPGQGSAGQPIYGAYRGRYALMDRAVLEIVRPVYIMRLDHTGEVLVDPNKTTVVDNPNVGVTITIPPHTVKDESGQDYDGLLSVSNVPPELTPSSLPSFLKPSQVVTIQPMGLSFLNPAPISFPNTDGLPPGSQVDIWSMDHSLGRFFKAGLGQVSPDGTMINTIQGGIRESSWHTVLPPTPNGADGGEGGPKQGDGDGCELSSFTEFKTGNLEVDFTTVAYRSLGAARSLRFVYDSLAADPHPIIGAEATIPARSAVPNLMSARLKVAGVDQGSESFYSTAGLSESVDETVRLSVQFDAVNFKTGNYPFTLEMVNHFGDAAVSGAVEGTVLVNNQRGSPYGAGWQLDGVSRLHPQLDGSVVLTEGDGQILRFGGGVKHQYYAQGVTANDKLNITGSADETSYKVTNLATGAVIAEGGLVKLQHVAIAVGSAPIRLDTSAYVLATIGWDWRGNDWGGSFFYPNSKDGSFVGREFVIWVPVLTGNNEFLAFAHETSDVTIVDANGNTVYSATLPLNSFAKLNPPVLVATSYSVKSTGDISLQSSAGSAGTTVPSRTGSEVGRSFLFGTGNFQRGALALYAYSDGVVNSVNLDNGATVINKDVTAGNFYYFSGFGKTHQYLTSSADISVLAGDTEGGDAIRWIGDDYTIYRGRDGLDILVHGQVGPSSVVAGFNGTTVTIDGTVHSMNAGDRVAIAPDALHRVIADKPVQVQAFGGSIANNYEMSLVPFDIEAVDPTTGVESFDSPAGDYSRLERNADGTFTRRMKHGSIVQFDASGLQAAAIDRNGNTTSYVYDSSDRLIAIVDPSGVSTVLTYGADGFLDSVIDPAGRVTQFLHDAAGNLVAVDDPDATTLEFAYDTDHRMVSRDTKRGFVTRYFYGPQGRHEMSILPDGTTREIVPAQVIGIADPTIGTGTRSNPLPVVRPWSLGAVVRDGAGVPSTVLVDRMGMSSSSTDELGRVTTITRDSNGNPTRIVRPDGSVVVQAFDGLGNLLTTTEQGNNGAGTDDRATTFTYDSVFNQIVTVIDPKGNKNASTGATWKFAYDSKGNLLTATDVAGTVTEFAYDESGFGHPTVRGLMTRRTRAKGISGVESTERFSYDPAMANPSAYIDPLGRVTSFGLNTAGIVTSELVEGNDLSTATDQLTTYSVDAMNMITAVTDAIGGGTSFGYDEAGNLVRVTDAKTPAGVWTMSYDARERLVEVADPVGAREIRSYDVDGRLSVFTDRKGQQFSFTYDVASRLVAREFPFVRGSSQNTVVSYGYDNNANGNLADDLDHLAVAASPSGTVTSVYDAFDHLISTSTAGSPFQPSILTQYTYDKNSNRLTLRATKGSTTVASVDYTIDTLDRVTQLKDNLNGTATRTYDQLSRLTRQDLPGGLVTRRTYSTADETLSIEHLAASLISRFTYSYDPNGNVAMLVEDRPALGITGGVNQFTYDKLNRLLTATHPVMPMESFTYDPVGNRLTVSGGVVTWQYDFADRLLNDGTYSYQYDANGNMLSRTDIQNPGSVTNYFYDPEDRLSDVTLPSGASVSYRYDPFGRRVLHSNTIGAGATAEFVYDDEDILLEFDAAQNLAARYTHGPGIDEPIFVSRGGTVRTTVQDMLSSLTDEASTAGASTYARGYNAFGEIGGEFGAIVSPYGFAGSMRDADSDLASMRARYYASGQGRFTQEDLIRWWTTDPRHPGNMYSYTDSYPTGATDPSGLQAVLAPRFGPMFDAPVTFPMSRPFLGDPAGAVPIHGPNASCPPPGGRDPCKGLREILRDHQQRLANYEADPWKYDHENLLGQGRDEAVIGGRIRNLRNQIDNFRKQLEACEDNNRIKG